MFRIVHAGRRRFAAALLLLAVATLGLGIGTGGVQARSVRARLNTAVYTWQSVPGTAGSATHVRVYQVVNLNVGRIVTPRLSFHMYTAAVSDLNSKILGDPRFWLYSAYFRYHLPAAEIRLGRQRVFAGVGFGTIDGLRLIGRAFGRVEIDVFGGPRIPLDNGFGVTAFSGNGMWGGRLRTIGWQNTRIALSFVEKNRQRFAVLEPREFVTDCTLLKAVNSLEQRRVGLDVWQHFGEETSLGIRLDYDLLMRRVQRAELNGRTSLGSLRLGIDYIFRNPLVNANSIFSVFAQESNWEVAGRVLYFFTPSTGVFVRVAHVELEGISTNRVTFGLRAKGGYLGLSTNSGYGGDRWGLVGDYRWRLSKKLWLNLGSNYGIYRYYGLDGDWEHTLAAYFGVTCWLRRGLRLDAEVQGLQNQHVSSDLRFVVRLSTVLRKR